MAAFTKYHKQAFVKAVLADTPSIDHSELARQMLQAEVIKLTHPKIAAVYIDTTLQAMLTSTFCSLYAYSLHSCYLTGATKEQIDKAVTSCHNKLQKLSEASRAQHAKIREIEEKLKEMAASLTTIAAAHKALPEFAKYLPALAAKADRSLPVTSVTDTLELLKKSGWPK